jgi:hypothetical protein
VGFCKGTPGSDLSECIRHIKACILEIGHPMLLPMIIFTHTFSFTLEEKQRFARDWLRRIELSVQSRLPLVNDFHNLKRVDADLDAINRDLVQCYFQASSKPSVANLDTLHSMKEALELFDCILPEGRKNPTFRRSQSSFSSKIEFYKKRLQGIENYSNTTLQRLDIQRSLVSLQRRIRTIDC